MKSRTGLQRNTLALILRSLLALSTLTAATACSIAKDMMDSPPETEYTQAEAYAPMEATITDAAAILPDFPGFAYRRWSELPCSHNGLDDPNYTNIEISYTLPKEYQESELVRTQYVDVLREHWTSLGYEITTDKPEERNDGRIDHNLSAIREDGISLWYQVWAKVSIVVNSGCLPVSDPSEIEYITPAGGIEPGSDRDIVDEYFPDGIPTDHAAAIDPFAGIPAATHPFEGPETYEGLL